MTYKDHIINILKEAMRGPGTESFKEFLDKKAEHILSYIPEEKKVVKKSF